LLWATAASGSDKAAIRRVRNALIDEWCVWNRCGGIRLVCPVSGDFANCLIAWCSTRSKSELSEHKLPAVDFDCLACDVGGALGGEKGQDGRAFH